MKPLLRSAVIMSGAISGAAPKKRGSGSSAFRPGSGMLHSKFGPAEVVAAATNARKIDIFFTTFRKACFPKGVLLCLVSRGPSGERGLLLALFD